MTRRQLLQSSSLLLVNAAVARSQQAGLQLLQGPCGSPAVHGFEAFCFVDKGGTRRPVYVVGSGPPVIFLHELPGLTDEDLEAAKKVSGLGYTVVVPLFFGKPGGDGNALLNALAWCERSQFACNEGNRTSPHVVWLRDLTRSARQRWSAGRGVAVIGMCLTGAFPVALLSEPDVVAAVLCQPTIPFNAMTRFGWGTDTSALGVSPEDLKQAKSSKAPLLGLRYVGDWRSRPPRFERLVKEFEGRFFRLDIEATASGSHHSTLAGDYCEEAFLEMKAFLNRYLKETPDATETFPRRSVPNSLKEVRVQAACGGHHARK